MFMLDYDTKKKEKWFEIQSKYCEWFQSSWIVRKWRKMFSWRVKCWFSFGCVVDVWSMCNCLELVCISIVQAGNRFIYWILRNSVQFPTIRSTNKESNSVDVQSSEPQRMNVFPNQKFISPDFNEETNVSLLISISKREIIRMHFI